MQSLYFFGDSICFGQYVSADRVWTTRVSRHLSESEEFKNVLTQVTAVNGETSREALGRIHHCVTSHSPNLVWIQFGLNDANYWQTERGSPRVSLAGYLANIEEMIQKCFATGTQQILLATNHAVTKKLEQDANPNKYQQNAKVYNEALRRKFGNESFQRVKLIDIEREMEAYFEINKQVYLLPDGVHLNQEGHKEYFRIVLSPILSALQSLVVHE